jgi:hypothetical protein
MAVPGVGESFEGGKGDGGRQGLLLRMIKVLKE